MLAIAAVKLGSRFAVGVDVDEWSQINAKENVERNGCAQRIDIRLGSLDVVKESGFDFILANITRGVITELLPSMIKKLEEGGMFLFSGLLTGDKGIIESALKQNHCTTSLNRQRKRVDWYCGAKELRNENQHY